MLTKLRTLASLSRELGFRWLAFRAAYAFRLRTGLLRRQMPQYLWSDRPLATWLKPAIPSEPESFAEWRRQHSPKFFFDEPAGTDAVYPWGQQPAIEEADRLLNGEIRYFAHTFHPAGFPPNWFRDPVSGVELDPTNHWSTYSDDPGVDIKFIWEPNRFSFTYTLVRAYAATRDEKYAEAFWTLVEDWAQHNPPNTGPNWMDGQELALRLMAWTFGLHGFMGSPFSTARRISQLIALIASHAERIYKNASFAIYTHTNHSITEALGLWMTGLLFPELKNSEKYLSFGRMSLEREAREQIFPDGTYSMYSLNYHRFILHMYLYAIRLSEIHQFPFTSQLKTSVTKSIEYLSQLIDPETGEIPVYGSNDGALVLPLNDCDFTDYRPLLQLGWYITHGERLFDPGPWDEDIVWLCGADSLSRRERAGVRVQTTSFPHGGTYLLHSTNSHAVIRCADLTSRPSHADQLHMDLWIRGRNVAIDAGTYLYSGQHPWRNGLARTSVHNTVTVDHKDQMTMVSRFTWANWSKGKVLRHTENRWDGEHDGYKPISHKRTVMALEGERWLVIDALAAPEPHHYALHWLLGDFPFEGKQDSVLLSLGGTNYGLQVGMTEGNGTFSLLRADPNSTRGWRSRYYGHKEPAISVMLETDQPRVTFWSFFGFENDVVEVEKKSLRLNSKRIEW